MGCLCPPEISGVLIHLRIFPGGRQENHPPVAERPARSELSATCDTPLGEDFPASNATSPAEHSRHNCLLTRQGPPQGCHCTLNWGWRGAGRTSGLATSVSRHSPGENHWQALAAYNVGWCWDCAQPGASPVALGGRPGSPACFYRRPPDFRGDLRSYSKDFS